MSEESNPESVGVTIQVAPATIVLPGLFSPEQAPETPAKPEE